MTRHQAGLASRPLAPVVLATVLTFAVALATSPVLAQLPDPTFPIVHGRVYASALRGQTLYLGGEFQYAGPNTGAFGLVDGTSAAPSPTARVEGTVHAIAPDGEGGFYVGGSFQSVGGVPRANLAHIRAGGWLGSWNPGADGTVRALVCNLSTVYVGGDFLHVGGLPRRHVAAVWTGPGDVRDWNADADSAVHALHCESAGLWMGGRFEHVGGQPRPKVALVDRNTGAVRPWNTTIASPPGQWPDVTTLARIGSVLYVGGSFTSVGGQPRRNLAALDAATGFANGWDPVGAGSASVGAILPSGTTLVIIGGSFSSMGGLARANLAEVDATTGAPTSWNPGTNGAVNALALQGGTLYVGGEFSIAGGRFVPKLAAMLLGNNTARPWNPGAVGSVRALAIGAGLESRVAVGGGLMSLGAVPRPNLVAIDLLTDSITAWNPGSFGGVRSLSAGESALFAGGAFGMIGGSARDYLGALDYVSGQATSWVAPSPNATVECVAAHGLTVYAGGNFATIGGSPRERLAAFDASTGALTAWNPGADGQARSVAAREGRVFVGGSFATLGGSPRARLGAVDSLTGSPLPWVANADGLVECVVPDDEGRLYVGGWFDSIASAARSRIARLDAATGVLDPWNPGATGEVEAIVPHGASVYAGGVLSSLGGLTVEGAGVVDRASGAPFAWNPQLSYMPWTMQVVDGVVYAGGELQRCGGLSLVGLARIFPADVTPPAPQVVQPNGGEVHAATGLVRIVWLTNENQRAPYVDLAYSHAGPSGPWNPIATTLPNTGSYDWSYDVVFSPVMRAAPASFQTWIKVTATDLSGNVGSDVSDAPFWLLVDTGDAQLTPPRLALAVLQNPMLGAGQVRLVLPERAAVSVAVYDVGGREVARLADGERGSGEHVLAVPARLAPGVYLVRAQAGAAALTRKFVVLD